MIKIQIRERIDENEKMPGIMPFETFSELVSLGMVRPEEIKIEGIFINCNLTNIVIKGWDCSSHIFNDPELNFETTIEEIEKMPFEFWIRWFNK